MCWFADCVTVLSARCKDKTQLLFLTSYPKALSASHFLLHRG